MMLMLPKFQEPTEQNNRPKSESSKNETNPGIRSKDIIPGFAVRAIVYNPFWQLISDALKE